MSFLDETVDEFMSSLFAGTLDELASENDYWETAVDFVAENGSKQLKELSYKQRSWLIKIKSDAEERQ